MEMISKVRSKRAKIDARTLDALDKLAIELNLSSPASVSAYAELLTAAKWPWDSLEEEEEDV